MLSLISSVLKPDSDAVRDFAGFVITGDRENFSVGANLMQLLLAAQEGEWDELAAVDSRLPADDGGDQVLPAAGGGCAVRADAGRRRGDLPARGAPPAARGDLYRPGRGRRRVDSRRRRNERNAAARDRCGGGAGAARSEEIRLRVSRSRPRWATALRRSASRPLRMAKVSTSAAEARALGLLAPADRITMNRERLLLDAKAQAAALAEAGYVAPQPRTQIPAPGMAALATLETGVFLMGEAGYARSTTRRWRAGRRTFWPAGA